MRSLSSASDIAQESRRFSRETKSPGPSLMALSPMNETHGIAGSGFRAVTRHVIYEGHLFPEGVHGGGDGQPISDFTGVAQQGALGNRCESRLIALLHSLKDPSV